MLQMPRVPSVPKVFPNVQAHQLRQALAAEIEECIRALIASTIIPGWIGTLYRFIQCIPPGSVQNLARLPYQAQGPNSTAGTQIGVVYARLSWVIRLYWDLCLGGCDNARVIRQYIDELRKWAACGIEKCRLSGDVRHGYWLEVS